MSRKHVLFDLDGTLTDPAAGIFRSISHALDQLDLAVPPEGTLRRCIGPPLERSFEEVLGVPADRVRDALALYRERYSRIGMFENVVYPGVADLLGRLRGEGFSLWVATSKPTTFARSILEHFALATYFHAIYGSELDGTRSDKRILLAHLLGAEELGADDSVMIGDREHDVEAARENHLLAIGVTWGYGSRDELLGAGAASVVTDPAALWEVLRDWRSGRAPASRQRRTEHD